MRTQFQFLEGDMEEKTLHFKLIFGPESVLACQIGKL